MTKRSAISLRLPKLVQADDSVMSLTVFLTLHLSRHTSRKPSLLPSCLACCFVE